MPRENRADIHPFSINPKINPTAFQPRENNAKKQENATVFKLKTVVFMVAEAGLEPAASGL